MLGISETNRKLKTFVVVLLVVVLIVFAIHFIRNPNQQPKKLSGLIEFENNLEYIKNINPNSFNLTGIPFLILPGAYFTRNTLFVNVIYTAAHARDVRDELRAKIKTLTLGSIRPLFVVGRDEKSGPFPETCLNYESCKLFLIKEASREEDIILLDIPDAYSTLSLKTTGLLEWINEYCKGRGPRYLVKTDKDVAVNYPTLIKSLMNRTDDPYNSFVIAGRVWGGEMVQKDLSHKNYENVDFDTFPLYCSGTSYVLSNYGAQVLRNQRLKHPRYYNNEDVMLGILVTKLPSYMNAKPEVDPAVFPYLDFNTSFNCEIPMVQNEQCSCDKWWSVQVRPGEETVFEDAAKCSHFYADVFKSIEMTFGPTTTILKHKPNNHRYSIVGNSLILVPKPPSSNRRTSRRSLDSNRRSSVTLN